MSSEVKPYVPFLRDSARIVLSPFLRSEIITNPEDRGRYKFESYVGQGYGGIVLLKHFSLKDPAQTFKDVAIASDVLITKKAESANAIHQLYPGYIWLSEKLGVRINPLVTENSVKSAKKHNRPAPELNEGLKEFTANALETLKNGGLLFLAPEGGRRDNLEPYQNRSIGTLMASAKREKVENIVFLFVDVGLSNSKKGKWSKSWFNPLDKYDVRIGRALTFGEMLEAAGGKFGDIDSRVVIPEMQRTAAIEKPNRG